MHRLFSQFYALMLASLTVMTACAQAKREVVTIEGETLPETKMVTVLNMEDRNFRDSVEVKNGSFTYSAPYDGNETYYLFLDGSSRLMAVAVVEKNGDVPKVDLTKRKSVGTPINDQLAALEDSMQALTTQYTALMSQMRSETDPDKVNVLKKEMEAFGKKQLDIVCSFADRNQSNKLPAYLLMQVFQAMDFDKLRAYAESGAEYTKSPMFQPVLEYIEYMKPSMDLIGKKFTDVVGNDFDGKEHHLSEYVGKGGYVLVDFWASWCGPCMREMPTVKECWETYKSKGFIVVGISLDNDASKWRNAVVSGGYNWAHISDLNGWKSAAAQTYGVQSIPWNFLCDGEGRIVAVALRGGDLKAKLAEVYK